MGVPRTLAKGLSKLKEAAELRKLGGTQAERMARAAEQGYSIDFLHGSPTLKETDAISLTHPKRTDTGYLGNAVYGSRPEDEYIARAYAGRGGEVHRLKTRAANFKDFVYDENYRQNIGDFGQSIGVKADRNSPEWAQEFAERMQANGYEGARGLADDGTVVEYAIYNPAQVRSVNADFNPAHKDSSNLLAGIGNLAAPLLKTAATGTALYTGAAALAPEKVNAGPLQTLGRAAPYLTSAALGGAAALQSGDAEAGKLDALGRAAPYLATGALGAAMMTPQDTQAYNDYIRDEMEARTAADKFTQMRGSKAGYWEARRQELLDMVNGLGEMANNVVLPALDKPLQGYLGLAGTAGALAAGGTWDQAIQRGAMSAQRDSGQTFDAMGNSVAQAVAPISTPQQAQAIGNGVELGLNAATMFFSP